MAISFEYIAGPFGDCTSDYKVKLDKSYTVSEFVSDVVSDEREWGYIYIGKNCIDNEAKCEYRWGKLLSEFNERYLDRKIINATASGGWSRMDYYLTLESHDEKGD